MTRTNNINYQIIRIYHQILLSQIQASKQFQRFSNRFSKKLIKGIKKIFYSKNDFLSQLTDIYSSCVSLIQARLG